MRHMHLSPTNPTTWKLYFSLANVLQKCALLKPQNEKSNNINVNTVIYSEMINMNFDDLK